MALKVLRPELSATLGAERFVRETAIAARLNHPNILPLFDSGSFEDGSGDPVLYFCMPFVEGRSLRDHLRESSPLPVATAAAIARQVAEALDHAHQHGIVHRDIKPENVLLSGEHAFVADFGIALALDVGGDRLTNTGLSLGTPAYMSPEQATTGRLDGRSDLYSLGCMLYEMLAGHPPFTGATRTGRAGAPRGGGRPSRFGRCGPRCRPPSSASSHGRSPRSRRIVFRPAGRLPKRSRPPPPQRRRPGTPSTR